MANLFDSLLGDVDPSSTFAVVETDGAAWTYGSIIAESGRFANVLNDLDVQPGDRVVAQIPKSLDSIALYLACLRLGAIFVPLNTAYTLHEVDYFISDSAAALFVCDPACLSRYASVMQTNKVGLETLGAEKDGTLIEKAAQVSECFASADRQTHDIVAIVYTSGTTGRSKGAMLTHANLLSNASTLVKLWRFSDRDVLFHALPIFHTHGLFVATNVVMLSASSMIYVPKFTVDAAIEFLPQCTTMMGVPTYYTRLLNDRRLDAECVRNMRLFVSGSAPLLKETLVRFEQRTGHRILERYGMTETNMIASNPYDGERKAGTVGCSLPDVDVRIRDAHTGLEVSTGDVGILEVKGPNVFCGYWNNPVKTAEEFRQDGYFMTGDLACKDNEGYIEIVGRSKDVIVSGGLNVYPKEIETLLNSVEGVQESAVIGVPHPDFGEAVVGLLVVSRAIFCSDALSVEIQGKLAGYKRPKKLLMIPELPRNSMGKVLKVQLREQYHDLFTNS